jgi:curved DNA-binding protein CbpA
MDKGDDPYKVLSVPSDAPPEAIKKSYRKLALKHHPDRGGDPVVFSKISNAYEILGDEDERKNYDLQQQHGVCQGYDPEGPRFTSTSSAPSSSAEPQRKTYNSTSPEWTNSSTTTTTGSSPRKTTTGKTTTTTYSTTSSSPGGSSRFHDPYEVFKQHFGEAAADDIFKNSNVISTTTKSASTKKKKKDKKKKTASPSKTTTEPLGTDDIMGMSSSTKTVTHPNGQKEIITTTTYTRFDGSTFTKMESKTGGGGGGGMMVPSKMKSGKSPRCSQTTTMKSMSSK